MKMLIQSKDKDKIVINCAVLKMSMDSEHEERFKITVAVQGRGLLLR